MIHFRREKRSVDLYVLNFRLPEQLPIGEVRIRHLTTPLWEYLEITAKTGIGLPF
jgi:hypothetical protein